MDRRSTYELYHVSKESSGHHRKGQVVPDVVTASQSDEEDALIGSQVVFASGSESASTFGFASSSATGSSSHGRAVSSDDATSAGIFQCHQTPTLLRLLRSLIDSVLRASDGEPTEWVNTPTLGIKKAILNFVAKFFWLLVRNRVSHTQADNVLTWDRAVMVAALVAGFEIDFARMLIAEIHERAFKASTTYPFPCLIFQLCRDSGVPANVAAPHREPQIDLPLLGAYLVADVEQMEGADPTPPATTDDAPASQTQSASQTPSLSRATSSTGSAILPFAHVQKLEAQIATLLQHVKPWMQRSISESETRMERRIKHMMNLKVQAINKYRDSIELRVLE
uniref:Integrase core domain containing protein n=1 Tax=Solanum tuberosum TaxID=4113 RepID=M1DFS1_SOLTU